ncbi:lipid asymmetry maintenance protein MlaB [Martelella alba]|uniref:Lipid asymmetry maintenance protein MlaB n=1 Tax=Martelella alba TaxID=2590451 RepID=A0ABY2SS13_9HYPH|nr:lipid asymmetry maintenance protein MlaB [Martelella alba]TKI06910.1 lipid asymmetry maintenance protein MlaB [Martelella alba]
MAEPLSWQVEGDTLSLEGELDRATLLSLWARRASLPSGVSRLDVSRLRRVDSAGVAALLHLCAFQSRRGGSLAVAGATDRLRTLISLYKLDGILPCLDAPAR